MTKKFETIILFEEDEWKKEAIKSILIDYKLKCLTEKDFKKVKAYPTTHPSCCFILPIFSQEYDLEKLKKIRLELRDVALLFLVDDLQPNQVIELAQLSNIGLLNRNQSAPKQLIRILDTMANQDKSAFCDYCKGLMLDSIFNKPLRLSEQPLSLIEREMVEYLGMGLNTTEISKRMQLSCRKVSLMRSNLLTRYNCTNSVALITTLFKADML